ncbi:MAG: DUF58 domain-containing protein [Steroidobacteraceae bacterium]
MKGAARLRRVAELRLRRWSARRHGSDALSLTVGRRRIYIIPTRFGAALALLLTAMLIAGLNYNSNLGLAFGFLLVSLALIAMHHCHHNLLGLVVDANCEIDGFAGDAVRVEVLLRNDGRAERCGIEVRFAAADGQAAVLCSVPPTDMTRAVAQLAVAQRGVLRIERFELRTRHPLGWFRAWSYVHCPLTLFVAPQPAGGRAPPATAPGDEEFAGLRAYTAGMPLKHMAWKVLARGGAPAVRSYTGTAAPPKWLDWAALEPLAPEERLAQLCGWVLACDAAQRPYGLKLPDVVIAPAIGPLQRRTCLRALAAFPAAAA